MVEALGNLNLPFLVSEQSEHQNLHPPPPPSHTHTREHVHKLLICPSDSAVSETGCQREGIYYRIDLAMQLGGNGNFSFHFSLSNTSLWGTLKIEWSDVLWWLVEEQKKAGLWAEGKGMCVVLVFWQMWEHSILWRNKNGVTPDYGRFPILHLFCFSNCSVKIILFSL